MSEQLIKYIFDRQKEFNKNFVDFDNLNDKDRQHWTREYCLHLMAEIPEVLREINWKVHRKEDVLPVKSNLFVELIDIFKYTISIGLVWGMTPEEFLEVFDEKSNIVEQKYTEDFKLKMDKIVICDIDGVLCNYPLSFIDFLIDVKGYLEVPRKTPDTLDLRHYLQQFLTHDEITNGKLEYRTSGYKRHLQVNKKSVELLNILKKENYSIILMTARPYKKYKRIYSDTLHWLKSNNIPFDKIIWNGKKREESISRYGDKIEFFIEDDSSQVKKLLSAGYKCFLIDNLYNRGTPENVKDLTRVLNPLDILRYL